MERNTDLPILDELGAKFEAMVSAAWAGEADDALATVTELRPIDADDRALVERAERGDRRPAGPDRHTARRRLAATPSRAARERGAQARRVGRRAAIVLLLVCMIGGVAFAALNGGGSGDHSHTAPTSLGRAGNGAWSFSAYRDEGRLCTVFVPRGGELSGDCGVAPIRGQVRAGSAIAGGRRYVFGVAGPGVEQVSVSLREGHAAGADRRTDGAAVHDPVDRNAASDAGFPAQDGWFVLDLGPAHDAAGHPGIPAVVVPLDRKGRRAGPAYVDCSLGVIGPACKRRIEAAATGR
ncbi:MAG TPA: hypothetical protein VHS74_02900 [Solirubrobacterales bacterium]|jgi:hypothetical protein|nr:hypothetical protein [Solirubrobacterales bacterium]